MNSECLQTRSGFSNYSKADGNLCAVEKPVGEECGGNDEFRMANAESAKIRLEANGGGAGRAGVGLAGCFSGHGEDFLMRLGIKAKSELDGKTLRRGEGVPPASLCEALRAGTFRLGAERRSGTRSLMRAAASFMPLRSLESAEVSGLDDATRG